MKTLIKKADVLIDNQLQSLDVLIAHNQIEAIGSNLINDGISADRIIDATNKFLSPGLVDVHVHFREPGFSYKETIKSGSMAAAHGGYTTVCAMPNLDPTPDSVDAFEAQQSLNQKEGTIHVLQYATITEKLRSEKLVDFAGLAHAGAFAFTNDGVGVQTAGVMYQAMLGAAKVNKPLVAHTEDNSLLFGGVMATGKKAVELGLPGILSVTEASQIARDVLLAQATGAHYHICHVSAKESVAVVRWAKSQGIHVTAEVTPHHLLLNDCDIPGDDGYYKMNPPLRSKEDQLALIEGLLDGTIDMIATDHAPHGFDEKNQSMRKAPFGIVGIEQSFSLLYTNFVKSGKFTLSQLINWMSVKPADVFKIPNAGQIRLGSKANLTLFDLNDTSKIDPADFLSMGKNTPFIGQEVAGTTIFTMVDGVMVYQQKENR